MMILEEPGNLKEDWAVYHSTMGVMLAEAWFCPVAGKKVLLPTFYPRKCDAEFDAQRLGGVVGKWRTRPVMKGRP